MLCRSLTFLIALSACALPACAHAHERGNTALLPHLQGARQPVISAYYSPTWESRYHQEGRDGLDGDSLVSQTLQIEWESLSFGVWYGNSTEQHYDELHTSLLYNHDFGDGLEGYLGYNHVRFPHGEGHHDHEIHGGLSYASLPYDIEIALDAYHSFEADGFFAEASASREWELNDQWSTSLTAIFGVNQGYVADGHDGANHLALSWGLSYALTDSLALVGHTTYSWAIDRISGAADDELLKDFFHAGVGLEWNF